ncbi:hypothetical protein JMG10_23505 [Nostoc ellipsosporum NOK]|nr:hypothetical protein [Nostoc ellipsosporum NOK]
MRLVFLYGQAAAGKLTIGRALAARTGLALFHNHLVVDTVASVFPFGSDAFVRLREQFWLEVIAEAARQGQSLIFTFAPEPSVADDFPERVQLLVESHGGRALFVALTLDRAEQERRLVAEDRAAFGKLRSLELLRALRGEFERCMAAMPAPALAIDTGRTSPEQAAEHIARLL